MPRTAARRLAALALAAVVLATVPACGDDGTEEAVDPPTTVGVRVPEVVDEVCDDPVGDLSTLAVEQGSLAEPAGVDLVRGEVHLDAASLRVVLVTNGDIASVPDPTLTLFQGPPGMQASWELRMAQASGVWSTTLITYAPGTGEILIDEVREQLPVAPVVEGSTLTLDVPRDLVPPPLTLAWVFGASSTVAVEDPMSATTQDPTEATIERSAPTVTTFDECDTLFTEALGGTTSTTAP